MIEVRGREDEITRHRIRDACGVGAFRSAGTALGDGRTCASSAVAACAGAAGAAATAAADARPTAALLARTATATSSVRDEALAATVAAPTATASSRLSRVWIGIDPVTGFLFFLASAESFSFADDEALPEDSKESSSEKEKEDDAFCLWSALCRPAASALFHEDFLEAFNDAKRKARRERERVGELKKEDIAAAAQENAIAFVGKRAAELPAYHDVLSGGGVTA